MTPAPRQRALLRLAWLACGTVIGLTALLWIGGDRWWPVFPYLYGPRIAFGIFVLPALPLLFTDPRRGAPPFAIALGVFLFGILGFRIGPARLLPGPRANLRIVSYNVAGRPDVVLRLLIRLDSLKADVAVVAECPGLQGTAAALPPGWSAAGQREICLFSRYPILDWRTLPRPGLVSIARADLSIGGEVVHLGMVHLETPHATLMEFKEKSAIPRLGPVVRANLRRRDEDSRRASQWFAQTGDAPTIIAGDFNLPIESAVFRRYWSGYSDSFNRAGIGVGATYRYRWYSVRIDHVLTRGGVTAVRSAIGPDLGSDHLPVIADLVLPTH